VIGREQRAEIRRCAQEGRGAEGRNRTGDTMIFSYPGLNAVLPHRERRQQIPVMVSHFGGSVMRRHELGITISSLTGRGE